MEVFEVQECNYGSSCLNSLSCLGVLSAKCGVCKYAPNGNNFSSFWKPSDKKMKHPNQVAEKEANRKTRQLELKVKKQIVDKDKQALLRKAAAAERQTEKNIIRATKNSGRSHRDGDHTLANSITLDTKLQTNRTNPLVDMSQLYKVREDAKNAGNSFGALVLRTPGNSGVVVMLEDDFSNLIANL